MYNKRNYTNQQPESCWSNFSSCFGKRVLQAIQLINSYFFISTYWILCMHGAPWWPPPTPTSKIERSAEPSESLCNNLPPLTFIKAQSTTLKGIDRYCCEPLLVAYSNAEIRVRLSRALTASENTHAWWFDVEDKSVPSSTTYWRHFSAKRPLLYFVGLLTPLRCKQKEKAEILMLQIYKVLEQCQCFISLACQFESKIFFCLL